MLKHKFTASWSGRMGSRYPTYHIRGVRVSVQAGYQYARDNNIKLDDKFHAWHQEN